MDGELALALSLRCMAMVNALLAGLSLFSCAPRSNVIDDNLEKEQRKRRDKRLEVWKAENDRTCHTGRKSGCAVICLCHKVRLA